MTSDELTATDRRWIQVRSLLDRWFLAVVVILLLAVVMGGWLAYPAHVEPGTEETVQEVGSWSEQTDLGHEAEVQVDNPVFATGQVLSNQPVYFTGLSPDMSGTYAYAIATQGQVTDGSVDVDVQSSLVVRSVDGDGNTYWEQREPLDEASADGLEPGETVSTSFDANVHELAAMIDEVEDSLGASPGSSEKLVVVETTMSGTVGGDSVANSHTAEFVIENSGGTYTVETDPGNTASGEFSATVETEREYGALESYGSLAMIVVGLIALGWLVPARMQGELAPTEDELVALEAAGERAEFVDWLSRGAFPVEHFDGPRIELDSLEDIVDVAIDSNRRVIEDVNRGAYFVQDGDAYYVYEPEVKPPAFTGASEDLDVFGEPGAMDAEPDEEYGDLLDDSDGWSESAAESAVEAAESVAESIESGTEPSASPDESSEPVAESSALPAESTAEPAGESSQATDGPVDDPAIAPEEVDETERSPDDSFTGYDESPEETEASSDDAAEPTSGEASPEEALAAITADDGDELGDREDPTVTDADDRRDREDSAETDADDLEIDFDEDDGSSDKETFSLSDGSAELADSEKEVDPDAESETEAEQDVDPDGERGTDPEQETDNDPEVETDVDLDGQSVVAPEGTVDTAESRHETGESIFDLGTTRVPDSILTDTDSEDEESSDAESEGDDADAATEDELRSDGD